MAYVSRFIGTLVHRVNKKKLSPIVLSPLVQRAVLEESANISGSEIKMAGMILVKQHQLSRFNSLIAQSLH